MSSKALVAVLAAVSFSAFAQIQMSSGKGQVLDTTTNQPVPGATVRMECRRTNLGHGSSIVREVVVTTDKNGMYEFSFTNVIGCDFAYVYPAKAGYREASAPRYGYTTYHKIPPFRYLTPDADVGMERLIAITPSRVGTVFNPDGSPSASGEYGKWYGAFVQAKHLATTEREKQFVLERYCTILPQLHAALSDGDKVEVARYAYQYRVGNSVEYARHDYDAEVLPYCAGNTTVIAPRPVPQKPAQPTRVVPYRPGTPIEGQAPK